MPADIASEFDDPRALRPDHFDPLWFKSILVS